MADTRGRLQLGFPLFARSRHGKDWTIRAFLVSDEGGLDLDVAEDKLTLPTAIHAVKPWMSEQDTGKGSVWFGEIADGRREASVGIICLTRENLVPTLVDRGRAVLREHERITRELLARPVKLRSAMVGHGKR